MERSSKPPSADAGVASAMLPRIRATEDSNNSRRDALKMSADSSQGVTIGSLCVDGDTTKKASTEEMTARLNAIA